MSGRMLLTLWGFAAGLLASHFMTAWWGFWPANAVGASAAVGAAVTAWLSRRRR